MRIVFDKTKRKHTQNKPPWIVDRINERSLFLQKNLRANTLNRRGLRKAGCFFVKKLVTNPRLLLSSTHASKAPLTNLQRNSLEKTDWLFYPDRSNRKQSPESGDTVRSKTNWKNPHRISKMEHLIFLPIKYLPATNKLGARVKLILPRWENKALTLSYDRETGNELEQAVSFLKEAKIAIHAFSDLGNCNYALLVPFSESIKLCRLFGI